MHGFSKQVTSKMERITVTDEHAQCDFSGDTVDTGQVSQI